MSNRCRMFFVKVLIMILLSTSICYAAEFDVKPLYFNINVGNQQLEFSNPVVTINGNTYVPLREFANNLNMSVEWMPERSLIQLSEKFETGHSIGDFKFLKQNMNLNDIYVTIGEPDYYMGSGIVWGVYLLNDGNRLHIHDYMTGMLRKVSIETKDGARIWVEFDDIGNILIS